MKGTAHAMGYLLGVFVVIPLIIWVANNFILVGNNASDKEINSFIKNCYIDTVTIPEYGSPSYYDKSEQYMAGLARGGGSAFMDSYSFYSDKHKKYISVIKFDYLDEKFELRDNIFYENPTMTVQVNKDLLANEKYGTKENPLPVFPRELVKTGDSDSWLEERKKKFYISDSLNFIFIREYINRFMPEEDFKKIFRKE